MLRSHQGFFLLCSCFFFIMLFTQAASWQRILLRSDLLRKTPNLPLQTRSQQGFCSTSGCEAVLSQGWLRNIKELTLGTKQRFYFDTERPEFTPRCRTRRCGSGYVRSDSHLLRGFRGVTCFKVPGPESAKIHHSIYRTIYNIWKAPGLMCAETAQMKKNEKRSKSLRLRASSQRENPAMFPGCQSRSVSAL